MSQLADSPASDARASISTTSERPGADPTSSNARRYSYRPGLDGLRAIAVLVVMLYHADLASGDNQLFSGGFLGVDLFFVLSGYLITTLLLLEWTDTGSVDFKGFWGRRARRLLPAIFLVLALSAVYVATFATYGQNQSFRGDALSTLGYVGNWWLAFSGQSYFEQFQAPSLLRHTWSLAIEEQFYIFWPLIVLVGMKFLKLRISGWVIATLAGAWLSAGLMLVMFDPTTDPSRIYYGTDTRVQALLIGAALAFVLTKLDLGRIGQTSLQMIGGTGLLVTFALFWVVSDSDGWMYQGGYLLMAIASGAAIVVVASPDPGLLGRALSWAPLVWIGQRSYGLYLWHWPIYVIVDAELDIEGPAALVVKLGLTFGVSMLSYRLLEMPVRQGALGRHQKTVLIGSVVAVVGVILLSTTVFQPNPTGLEAIQLSGEGTCAVEEASDLLDGDERVLLVGDSVALTLGFRYRQALVPPGTTVKTCAIVGCGVARGALVPSSEPPPPRNDRCEAWPENWDNAVATFDPTVSVIFIGAWEVFDRIVNDELLEVGTPEYESYLRGELDLGADILTRDGAPVIMLTSPCFDDIGTFGADRGDVERVAALNEVIVKWSADRSDVDLIDLNAFVCPDGVYQPEIDGVTLHEDGAHYLPQGAILVWNWLFPQIEATLEAS